MKLPLLLTLSFCLLTAPLLPAATPEEVVTTYFDKVKTNGFDTIAGMMHPDEVKKFHDMMAPVITEFLAESEVMFKRFADPADPKKPAKLSDLEFMNLFMQWIGELNPGFNALIKDSKIQALGHVQEGDLRHVVVRMRTPVQGMEVEKMSVMTIRDFQGTPMMVLSGEMKGIADNLKRQREQKAATLKADIEKAAAAMKKKADAEKSKDAKAK